MSAKSRATSARTSKEQRRVEESHLDRMKQRARRQKQEPCGHDVRQWVESIKHKKPAPTVLDDRGNAMAISSVNSKFRVMKRKAQRTCLTIWKMFTRLRVILGNVFASWAQRTQGRPFVMSRTLLCYAPVEPTSQGTLASSMEEID